MTKLDRLINAGYKLVFTKQECYIWKRLKTKRYKIYYSIIALYSHRFILTVGSGENLNEHILGDRWPPAPIRTEMLEEAVDIIRQLLQGGTQSIMESFIQ